MSAEAILDGLLATSLKGGRGEMSVIELYTSRLLELERDSVYDYIYERDEAFLACLSNAARKADFVLRLWQIAPPEHWAAWAATMPSSYKGRQVAARAAAVIEHMLEIATRLEPDSIRSITEHLPPIRSALAALDGEADTERIKQAARAALEESEWWNDEKAGDVQCALHELIRAIEAMALAAAADLRQARALDIVRCPLDEPVEIKAMLKLVHDLDPETYGEIEESLVVPDPEQRPLFYAEITAALVVIQVRDPMRRGGSQVVAANLRRIKQLASMGNEYWPQRRTAANGCLDLKPSVAQLDRLSRHVGAHPTPEGTNALVRWTADANRQTRANAISRMIRPTFDGTNWAAALSESEYNEAPVIRRLATELLKDGTTVGERRRMASMVKGLRIRTQGARNDIADLVVALLRSKPKNNLSVALVLCEGLGPDHKRHTKLKRAFEHYARKQSHKYTPVELQAIAAVGIDIPKKHLSRGAMKHGKELAAQGLSKVRGLAKFAGLG